MPCESRLNSNLGGFPVTYFTDKNYVRVLTDDGSKSLGKGEVYLCIDLNLADPFDLVLNRIFNGNDVDVGLVNGGKGRIEGSGFSASGRPSDQNDPVRGLNKPVKFSIVLFLPAIFVTKFNKFIYSSLK